MKKCIGILAYDRPKHLYVALDSIYRMVGVEDWFVCVYFDGILSPETRSASSDVIGRFPIDKVGYYKSNLGILWATLGLMRDMFYKEDCEAFLFMAEDLIIRSDTLELLKTFVQGDAFVYQLSHHSYQPPGEITWSTHFNQCGFVIFRDEFVVLDNWVKAHLYLNCYLDKVKLCLRCSIEQLKNDCDSIIECFIETNKALCKFPIISYVAHTGLVGMNSFNTEACANIETEIFTKPKELWLTSFAGLWPYTPGQYDSSIEYMLIPNHFVYV